MYDRNSKQSRSSRASSLHRTVIARQSYGFSDKIPVIIIPPPAASTLPISSRGHTAHPYGGDKSSSSSEQLCNSEDQEGNDLPIPVSPKHIAALYSSHRWQNAETASADEARKARDRKRLRIVVGLFLCLVLVVVIGIVAGIIVIKQLRKSQAESSSSSTFQGGSNSTSVITQVPFGTGTPTFPVPAAYVYPTPCEWEEHCPGSRCVNNTQCDGADTCSKQFGVCAFCIKAGRCVDEHCQKDEDCSEPWKCGANNRCVMEFRYSSSSFPINPPSATPTF